MITFFYNVQQLEIIIVSGENQIFKSYAKLKN